jgi:hypothetical protein
MKGLELSEKYYRAVGAGMIEAYFPDYQERIAVGLAGLGSECFGFDDEYSRDHDWGPAFCMWLEKDDYDTIGPSLQKAYEQLPGQFMGFQRKKSRWGDGRVGALDIGDFYASFIGVVTAPKSYDQWLTVPEANLAACSNGRVFHDPLGRFSSIRARITQHYPEDVRLKKVAARCMTAAQSGQYNYIRCRRRQANYPAHHSLVKFCEDMLSLVFLLNRRYMPFYKWSSRAAEELPILGSEMARSIDALVTMGEDGDQEAAIEFMCARVIEILRAQELSDSESDFLADHGPRVHSRIRDDNLKRIDIWWAGG